MINITCKYTDSLPIDQLEDFQGKLKTITKGELEKLKQSILKYGFSFPVFVWQKKILDGHQRLKAVKSLIKDGHQIDEIPIVFIEAKNQTEAAEKLLLISSRYAEMDQGGFQTFIYDQKIDLDSITELIELPEIDLSGIYDELAGTDSDIEKVQVTMEQPRNQVEYLDRYLVGGRHILIVCKLVEDWPHWIGELKGNNVLFMPYASFYAFHGVRASDHKLVVIQPDPFIAGKMLDNYQEVHGEDSIKKL